jgi:PAS domain S-box-containing protein
VSEPSLEVVAEAIPHIVWLSDASGSTDYFNERGTDYTGFPRQANYGWKWVALVHPDDAERARLGWEHATRTVTPFEFSYRLRRADGEYRWHALRALPVRGEAGEIVRWIGTADDVTDSSFAVDDEARVERQIAQLKAMLDVVQAEPSSRFGHVDADVLARRVNDSVHAADTTRFPRAAADSVDDAAAPIGGLTPRDLNVARLVGRGYTNAEIANLLGFSLRTIEASRSRLRRTLGLRTRAELVRFAHDMGIADDG